MLICTLNLRIQESNSSIGFGSSYWWRWRVDTRGSADGRVMKSNHMNCTITSLNNTWAICVRPNYRLINWNKCDKICKRTNELTLSENAEILNYFN